MCHKTSHTRIPVIFIGCIVVYTLISKFLPWPAPKVNSKNKAMPPLCNLRSKTQRNTQHISIINMKIKTKPANSKNAIQQISFIFIHFHLFSSINLELAIVGTSDNNVVDLKNHAAKLSGEQELLTLGDERVDDEVVFHVCGIHVSDIVLQGLES
jgi:hypothetical protein